VDPFGGNVYTIRELTLRFVFEGIGAVLLWGRILMIGVGAYDYTPLRVVFAWYRIYGVS